MALGQEKRVPAFYAWPAFLLIFICYISTWEWLCVIQVKGNTWSTRAQKYPEGIEDVFFTANTSWYHRFSTIDWRQFIVVRRVLPVHIRQIMWTELRTSDGFVQTFGIRLAELAIVHSMQRLCVSASNKGVNWEIWQEVLDEMSEIQTSISDYFCRMKAHWKPIGSSVQLRLLNNYYS